MLRRGGAVVYSICVLSMNPPYIYKVNMHPHVMMNVHTCACNIAAGILHQVIMHVHVSTNTYMPLYAELEPQGGIWMTANGYRLTDAVQIWCKQDYTNPYLNTKS